MDGGEEDDEAVSPTSSTVIAGDTSVGSFASDLAELAATGAARAPIGRGTVIDGYRIEGAIGEGGMGVVYLARDVRLERDVAIKVGTAVSAPALVRAGREALALARLSDPNVVVVHQVGEVGGRLYIAMEHVAGGNARQWLRAKPRTWREVVGLYAAAGDGLAAAHAVGLVHRDFKPDNVLVGQDGRPRVADFGLARDATSRDGEAPAPASSGGSVTQTGAVMGTLGYMAPEQLAGEAIDARADQFSFCASLWEALFGIRPFEGTTPAAIAASIARESPRTAPRRVPRHVVATLTRGLRADRDARWPSMTALLVAVRRDPHARRRRLAIAAGLAVGAGGLALVLARSAGPTEAPCTDAAAQLTGAWDAQRRSALEQAFVRTGDPVAVDRARRAAGRLDAYAAVWRRARTDACEATHVRHEQSADALDRRMWCLDDVRDRLRATVDVLSRAPDGPLIGRAVALIDGLEDPAGCARADQLAGELPPPFDPAARARIDAVQARLSEADALVQAGRGAQALPIATAALADARTIGRPPLLARALAIDGNAEELLGHTDLAEQAFQEAARVAAGAHDDRAVADAWVDLLFLLASQRGRIEDSEHMVPVAESALARVGHPPRLATSLHNARAQIALTRGRLDDALAEMMQVLPLAEAGFGADSVQVADVQNNIGAILAQQGHYAEALERFERTLAMRQKALGEDHPKVATALENIASTLGLLGRLDEARERLQRVLAIQERLFGPTDLNVATTLSNLAMMELELEHRADARASAERALAIRRQALPPDHPELASAMQMLGNVEHWSGDNDVATRELEAALAIYQHIGGPDSIDVAHVYFDLGNVASTTGRFDEAEADYRRARKVLAAKLGADHPDALTADEMLVGLLGRRGRSAEAFAAYATLIPREERVYGADNVQLSTVLHNYGVVLRDLHRPADARATLLRALAIREHALGADAPSVGQTLEILAQVDRALGRHADAAAEEARAKAIAARTP